MSRPDRINGPSDASIGSSQYHQTCLFALEPSVTKLIELAADAGWDEQQAVCAIMCIAALKVDDKTLLKFGLVGSAHADGTDFSFPGSVRFRGTTPPGLSSRSDCRAPASPWDAVNRSDDENPRDP